MIVSGLAQDHELALQLYESSVEGGNNEAKVEVHRLQRLLSEQADASEKNGEWTFSGRLMILLSMSVIMPWSH